MDPEESLEAVDRSAGAPASAGHRRPPPSATTGGATGSSTRSTRAASPTATATGVGDLPGIIAQLDYLTGPRCRCPLALADLPVTGSRRRLRRQRPHDGRSALRDRRRLRPARRRGPPAWHPGDPRPGHEPHQRPARVVPGQPGVARRPVRRLVPVARPGRRGRRTAGRSRRTTGCRGSAGRPGNGTPAAASSTCTRSWSSSPS